jgi:hypothetical protein
VNVSMIDLITHPIDITDILNSNDFNFRKLISAIITTILRGVTIFEYSG